MTNIERQVKPPALTSDLLQAHNYPWLAGVFRLDALLLATCVVLAGVVFLELESSVSNVESRPPAPSQKPANQGPPPVQHESLENLVATILARPLFNPTRRPPDTGSSQNAADPGLRDVRLTGIVVAPDRRLAIFALSDKKKSLPLSEGETLNGWRLDSILQEQVSLSGPGGTTTLMPKADTSLVRQVGLPAAPAQPQPVAASGPAAALTGPARTSGPRQLGGPKAQPPAFLFEPNPPHRAAHDQ
jgi:hypothetical protein